MAYTVAEAEVTVTPDARNFGRDLRAQITPEMDAAGKDAGQRISKELGNETKRRVPDIARTNGRDLGERLAKEAGDGFQARGALIGSAIAAGLMAGAPLLIAAAGVVFGGVAAIVLHNQENVANAASDMGERVTLAYKHVADDAAPFLVKALDDIGAAAVGMAPMVESVFTHLGPAIDGVTQGVIGLAQNALPGMIKAVEQGAPVFSGFASFLGSIGTGIGNLFSIIGDHADAAGTALSALGDALSALLTGLGELLGAGAELGSMVLPALASALGAVANVLGFLGPILPQVALGFLAIKTASLLSTGLAALATSLQNIGASAMAASEGMLGLKAANGLGSMFATLSGAASKVAAALPGIGLAVAGILLVAPAFIDNFNHFKDVEDAAAQGAKDLTAALQASKGAIDENVRATAAKAAQDAGLLGMADEWGVSKTAIVNSLLGQKDAMANVQAGAAQYEAGQKQRMINAAEEQKGQTGVGQAYNTSAAQIGSAAEDNVNSSEAHRKALDDLAGATDSELGKEKELAEVMGASAGAIDGNATRLQNLANTASAGSTAISLLKGALDVLTGASVNLGQAEAAVTLAIDNAINSVKGEKSALVDANGELDRHTVAGAKAFQSLTNLASGMNNEIAVMEEQGATTAEVTKRDGELRASFIDTAQKMGFSSQEANRLADQILGIPAERKTEISADTKAATDAAAAFKKYWESINNRTVTLTYNENHNITTKTFGAIGRGPTLNHDGGIVGFDDGGFAGGGLRPNMAAGLAKIVGPNTWRVIGDRSEDDEAYIPINDSARSLATLAVTAHRMGYGLTGRGAEGGGGRTDARQYHFSISSPSDPHAIARDIREAQRDLEFLHG